MNTTELAVIGAGPGGLAAALTAANAGLQVTLIDEAPHPGGQYLRGANQNKSMNSVSRTERNSRQFLEQLPHDHIQLLTSTLVWGLEANTLALHGPHGTRYLQAKQIIIATGGRELVLPFPGWTRPGVMTLGAAQILAKEHGLMPGKRILLAGSGPLLLASAYTLISKGAHIVGILEATHPTAWLAHAPAMWGNFDRLAEGWQYLKTIQQHKVPYLFGRTVAQAHGDGQLTAVSIAQLNRQGHPLDRAHTEVEVDALCLGFGLIPNTELAQLAGCQLEYAPRRGGWVPVRTATLQTSQPNLYAVGEAAGIGGASMALVEGQLAGTVAAQTSGKLAPAAAQAQIAAWQRKLRPLRRFEAMLNTLFSPPLTLNALATDDTLTCRCQEVRVHTIRQAIRAGSHSLSSLKNHTHVGQGQCQGRTCGPLLARLVAEEIGSTPETAGQLRPRPPLKPLPLSALAQEPS